MNILVTGGAGFIGSHLVDWLIADGHTVLVLDDFSTGKYRNVNATYEVVNIVDEKVHSIISDFQPELVYHLAAQVSVVKSVRNPMMDALTNVLGTVNLLSALAKTRSCRRVVFTSTGGVMYGECATPATEQTTPKPANPYAVAKLCAEQYLHYFARTNNFSATVFRLANVYGPRQNAKGEAGVIAIFKEALELGADCNIYGDGKTVRDYVFVEDVIIALFRQLDPLAPCGMYNIGTGIGTSTLEIFDVLKSYFPKWFQWFLPARDEVRRSVLDATKAKQELGWEARYDLLRGIEKYMETPQ